MKILRGSVSPRLAHASFNLVSNLQQQLLDPLEMIALDFERIVFDYPAGTTGVLQLFQQIRQIVGRCCQPGDHGDHFSFGSLFNSQPGRLFFRRLVVGQGFALTLIFHQLATALALGRYVKRCASK